MKRLIDIILRNGVSKGSKRHLSLPVDKTMSAIFNTPLRHDDCLSVETDGVNVTVVLYGSDDHLIQEDLDRSIAHSLTEYLELSYTSF